MALTQVTGPYPIFTDLDGSPLDDGYLYIGAINQDPETNPIQVFWDSALTIPATQPIRTNSGYAYRNGTPALMYTGGAFSITIRNKRQEFVLYSPVGYGFDPAAVSASVVKNDFIGNGVQVAFVLSASPSTILATNIFINGVYQEKDSYTLSGNTITFSIAPPLSSSIEILTNETGIINSGNATAISYTYPASGAVAQTVQTRLEQYVSVKDFGAVGDGVANDTAAIHAARDSGATKLYFPKGTYRTTGIVFGNSQSVVEIEFEAGAKLYLVSAASRIALDIQKNVFTISGRCEIDGNGTAFDGLATIGIRHGTSSQGCNYFTADHLIIREKFSSRGFVAYAFVNIAIYRADIYAGSPIGATPSTCYGISFETGASACTMAQLGQIYINGGRRGFNGGSVSWFSIDTITVEYSGRGGANTDGGIHLSQCAVGVITNIYGEQNERNMVRTDSNVILINNQMFTALTSPDVFTYSAVAFADRGGLELTNRSIKVGEMLPDSTVDSTVTTGLHLQGATSSQFVTLNGTQILKCRITGWTVGTGTPQRGAFAAAAAGTASGSYVQAELQGALNRIAVLEARLLAMQIDLTAHGLIGA